MKVHTDKKKIEAILDRGIIAEILPDRQAFVKKLFSGERLTIYIGVDPTADTLHLSHAKNFILLEEFRRLGHRAIVLFGDFTAQIGDPSGRSAARRQLSSKEVRQNMSQWLAQVKPLLDFDDKENPPEIVHNSSWLSKLNLKGVLELASNFTVQQMLERDMFVRRQKEGLPVHLHEFLYPLLQGYDSVAMNVDAELCGTDQIFNALVGRTLLKRLKGKEKFVVAVNMMANPKTGELMSKSRGTGVFLSSPPEEMYGAIMAQPDEMIDVLLINCTRIPLSERGALFAKGPREAKGRVAFEIIKRIFGEAKARKSEDDFVKRFQRKETPEGIDVETVRPKETVGELLLRLKLAPSRSAMRRLIEQGGVRVGGRTVKDEKESLPLSGSEVLLAVGKRKLIKLINAKAR